MAIYFDMGGSAEAPGLQNYLTSFDSYTQAGQRLWFVLTDKTTDEINAEMKALPFMQADGFTAVIFRVGQGCFYHGRDAAADQWLRDNWKF